METKPEYELTPDAPEAQANLGSESGPEQSELSDAAPTKGALERFRNEFWFWVIRWWLFNETFPARSERFEEIHAKIDALPYRDSRVDDMLAIGKSRFEASTDGFRAACDRLEKFIGVLMIVLGFVASTKTIELRPKGAFFLGLSFALLMIALATLILGLTRIRSRTPGDFETLVAMSNKQDDPKAWVFEQARQYAIAGVQIGKDTTLIHWRLMIASALLVLALVSFGCRWL